MRCLVFSNHTTNPTRSILIYEWLATLISPGSDPFRDQDWWITMGLSEVNATVYSWLAVVLHNRHMCSSNFDLEGIFLAGI